ncbi:CRTAC1 family protein [Myxococcota bacterium]|nr:CRTAC1 family protein [Myxococcota bacterium]
MFGLPSNRLKLASGALAAGLAAPGAAAAEPFAVVEVSAEAGIHVVNVREAPDPSGDPTLGQTDVGGGLAWIDYDGDGYEDLFVAVKSGPNEMWRNQGDGTFVAADVGVAGGASDGSSGVAVGDFDGDGDADLFVTGDSRNRLFLGVTAAGSFADATTAWGVEGISGRHPTSAAVADVNLDGTHDLLVGNAFAYPGMIDACGGCPTEEAAALDEDCAAFRAALVDAVGEWGEGCPPDTCSPDVLYLGDGASFVEDAEAKGIATPSCTTSITLFRLNDNDFLDPYLGSALGADWVGEQLYNNRGLSPSGYVGFGLTSTDSVYQGIESWGVSPADYDLDGLPDLLVSATGGNLLFRGAVADAFEEVAAAAGVLAATNPDGTPAAHAGGSLFDVDGDGLPDAVVPNGSGPDRVFHNQGDGTFIDEGALVAGAEARLGERTLAFADYDRDGDLDWAVGALRDADSPDAGESAVYLYRNDSSGGNHFVAVTLRPEAASEPYGAVIEVHAGGVVRRQVVHGGGGHLSQSTRTRIFGLGAETTVDRIIVDWPLISVDEEWTFGEVTVDDPHFELVQGTGTVLGGGGDDDTSDDDTSDDDAADDDAADDDAADDDAADDDAADDDAADDDAADDDAAGPVPVDDELPSGCGCANGGSATSAGPGLLLAGALALVPRRRHA